MLDIIGWLANFGRYDFSKIAPARSAQVEPTEPWPRTPKPSAELSPREKKWLDERLGDLMREADNRRCRESWPPTWFPEEAPAGRYVEVFMYWRIDRAGEPTVSICDDPMSHPHAHLVRIAIPEDVQKCILATKNPPECLIIDKKGYAVGACPKQESEPTNAP